MMDHTLVFPVYDAELSSHVSMPYSSLSGMVLNRHTSSPVRTSKPRMSPGGAVMFRGPSEMDDPTTTTSPTTSGGEMTWYARLGTGRRRPSVRSILPSVPKLSTGRPVRASTAHRCAEPVATKMCSASGPAQ